MAALLAVYLMRRMVWISCSWNAAFKSDQCKIQTKERRKKLGENMKTLYIIL